MKALIEVLSNTLLYLESSRDELRDLDAAIGDGDLGITVTSGARAVREALAALPEDAVVSDVLKVSAKQFGSANPSTFAALISGGLLAAYKIVPATSEIDKEISLQILQALFDSIKSRGKAELGDKTILDAIAPALAVLQSENNLKADELLIRLIGVVETSIEETSKLISRQGRAAWIGERTIGHRDAGSTAFLRFLEALHHSLNK
jgi:phosphoenolpyruvate---glycerone phosphotransferase subunit DhaL